MILFSWVVADALGLFYGIKDCEEKKHAERTEQNTDYENIRQGIFRKWIDRTHI
jgi:hypothetical protein